MAHRRVRPLDVRLREMRSETERLELKRRIRELTERVRRMARPRVRPSVRG